MPKKGTLGFTKGDPHINRQGRLYGPKHTQLLEDALVRKFGSLPKFWNKVAAICLTDVDILKKVIDKLAPNRQEISGDIAAPLSILIKNHIPEEEK